MRKKKLTHQEIMDLPVYRVTMLCHDEFGNQFEREYDTCYPEALIGVQLTTPIIVEKHRKNYTYARV